MVLQDFHLLENWFVEKKNISDEERYENLQIFKDALEKVMNLNNWHAFINIVGEAGYISDKLIASSNAVVFSYVLYLIAKYDYKLDAAQLKKCISKWFFMSTITYFYTGSTESEVEKQFADLRDVKTAEEFLSKINYKSNKLNYGNICKKALHCSAFYYLICSITTLPLIQLSKNEVKFVPAHLEKFSIIISGVTLSKRFWL